MIMIHTIFLHSLFVFQHYINYNITIDNSTILFHTPWTIIRIIITIIHIMTGTTAIKSMGLDHPVVLLSKLTVTSLLSSSYLDTNNVSL